MAQESLDKAGQEMFIEVIDDELDLRGLADSLHVGDVDVEFARLPGKTRAFLEEVYLIGSRDALARVLGRADFQHPSSFAVNLRNDLEGELQTRKRVLDMLDRIDRQVEVLGNGLTNSSTAGGLEIKY